MTAIPQWYNDVFDQYRPLLQSKQHIYIALSAGVDSNLLLHWLSIFKDRLPPITTLHVNHNWHGDYSQTWSNFARNASMQYGFEHIHAELHFSENDPRGLEAAGREERYKKMSGAMVNNSLLLTAHHRSDQAETLFQRLLRSSGIRGLGAMRDHTTLNFSGFEVEILRPFLSLSKDELYRVAKKVEINWMEDYTNHEVDEMVRNIIRNDIYPKIKAHFPHYEAAFYQSTQFIQEAHTLLSEIGEEDLDRLSAIKNQISRTKFCKLSYPRQKNLLQHWLLKYNIILTQEQIAEFFRSFIENKPTHQSQFIMGNFQIHYFQGYFYLVNHKPYENPPKLIWNSVSYAPAESFWQSKNLQLIPRENGVRFHPITRNHSQTVKKLLQEENLPIWQRKNIWMLIDSDSEEIYWISHLGLTKSLESEITKHGTMPILDWS